MTGFLLFNSMHTYFSFAFQSHLAIIVFVTTKTEFAKKVVDQDETAPDEHSHLDIQCRLEFSM